MFFLCIFAKKFIEILITNSTGHDFLMYFVHTYIFISNFPRRRYGTDKYL